MRFLPINELRDISMAIRVAAAGRKLRVVFLGRGTTEAQDEIRRTFDGTSAEISNLGIRDAKAIALPVAASRLFRAQVETSEACAPVWQPQLEKRFWRPDRSEQGLSQSEIAGAKRISQHLSTRDGS